MNAKIIRALWSISLIGIGIATLLLAVANVAAITPPDTLVRILGVVDLLLLPVLAFSSLKKAKRKQ